MEEFDVLGYLKKRQNELERVNHPFVKRSPDFRYLYAYGVGVLAIGSMKSMSELQERYAYFLECIALPKKQREMLIVDINQHFEFRLTETLKILKTKEVQYCFLADLYLLSNPAVWSAEYCRKVIENFMQIFHTSEPEIRFFQEFNDAVLKADMEKARECYHHFREQGFEIPYRILQYFFRDFTDEDAFSDITVLPGKTVYLDKPTQINGDVIVERGGSLLLDGADVLINGRIVVNGGRISLRNTKLKAGTLSDDILLTVREAAVVRMMNSTIDCNGQCGFLEQDTGRLLVEEVEFLHAKKRRMITFSGNFAQFVRSSFSEGEAGFIYASGSAQMKLVQCDFYKADAEYGAALLSDSIDNMIIQECSFRSCSAKYLGAAIYFKYQKLGQVVKDCVCRQCYPEENAVFNAYEDDFELKVR